MTATAQGIAVFMFFGAGLVAGLLGQIGDAINSARLERISDIFIYAVPFEALYQHGLYLLTSEQRRGHRRRGRARAVRRRSGGERRAAFAFALLYTSP